MPLNRVDQIMEMLYEHKKLKIENKYIIYYLKDR